jgi:hypothetical protein
MKAFLMQRDRDFDAQRALPSNEAVLTQDLELTTLLNAMAAGDPFLFEVARRALLLSLRDPDVIGYRQAVLRDCLDNQAIVRELYDLAGAAIMAQRSVWGSILRDSPRSMLGPSVQKMVLLVEFLRRLRELSVNHAAGFRSDGFRRFFAMIAEELDDEYFALIEGYLKELRFKGGPLLSARLAGGNRGTGYTLRRAPDQRFIARLLDRSGYGFTLAERDEAGARALAELEDRGMNLVSNALAQSVDHVLSFFVMLRTEVGFYVASVNLHEQLVAKTAATTFPAVISDDQVALQARGLVDACLALTIEQPVVRNDVDADGKALVMITGANQGGKSTFLRSVGLAQLMAQCGMFVAADAFRANVCDGVFTHYKREEDESMESGKLDEELARMSEVADHITPHSMLLCNESFASTNEREGSEIARHVIDALLEENVKVLFVTHMFDLADGFYRQQLPRASFLRAERGSGGARPFRLSEGRPLPTSYGEDSYRKIFGKRVAPHSAGRRE